MTTGDFARRLRVLNPKLRVCAFENSNKLAGLYFIDKTGEWFDICGVDKGYVPEYTEWDSAGHIVKSGWRRVYFMLVQLKLTTPEKVRQVCPGFYLHWSQTAVDEDRRIQIAGDPIAKKLAAYGMKETLSSDDILEVATDIREKDTQYQKEETNKERWFLETWKDRGGNLSDKPTI